MRCGCSSKVSFLRGGCVAVGIKFEVALLDKLQA